MAQLFVRIELRGTPGQDIYSQLHNYMMSKNWRQKVPGSRTNNLPHATYQGTFANDEPDLQSIARKLRVHIESTIWRNAIVLVIRSAAWAQSES
jgi:hypothetical protein